MPELPDFDPIACEHERDPLAMVTTGNPPIWRCRKCGARISGAIVGPPLDRPITETPDFEQIALALMDHGDDHAGMLRIAEQLRQVWNARGAADASVLLSHLLTELQGWDDSHLKAHVTHDGRRHFDFSHFEITPTGRAALEQLLTATIRSLDR